MKILLYRHPLCVLTSDGGVDDESYEYADEKVHESLKSVSNYLTNDVCEWTNCRLK